MLYAGQDYLSSALALLMTETKIHAHIFHLYSLKIVLSNKSLADMLKGNSDEENITVNI